jgi:hypothetical protein
MAESSPKAEPESVQSTFIKLSLAVMVGFSAVLEFRSPRLAASRPLPIARHTKELYEQSEAWPSLLAVGNAGSPGIRRGNGQQPSQWFRRYNTICPHRFRFQLLVSGY